MLRTVPVDGSPGSVAALADALAAALDGTGPVVRPVAADAPATPEPTGELPEGAAVLVSTSGSTGEPKHVVLTAAALTASAKATADRLGGPGRWVLPLPAEHVAGVQVIVRALLAGAPPEVQDVRDGFRPAGFARTTARLPHGARRYTSLVPTQLLRILHDGSAPLEALRGYAAVLVGGAALDAALREQALAAGVRVVTTYGMSETAGGCVYDGVPLDGVTVDIDVDGRILLGGPTVAAGYLGDAAATAESFVGGRFRTGDLGRLDDGRLTVLGRADDVVVTGGEKVAPAAVERVLSAQPGIADVCVVGVPDAEWGAVVAAAVVADENFRRDRAAAAVRAEIGRAAVPHRWLTVAEIPLRGIGKPDRAEVRRLLSATAATE
ncbi:MAG: o-succinylbenzoate--CoA ligase [Pseudonocardia sp.]|uniref:o-succinylbenzoate--CoA ligase n=1 Tax=unclassified Pseudonocardia TaxID=2619320 RepID=UPI000AB56332|nr:MULTISPECIES: o-succinylbenzoate--CoA ligase [unclassified Pseudonocardia]MBN9108957.1 o-succinylbenzoate--CoA ligase [Pseudonocardia sp.]